jgi:hypothetical protein
MEDLEEKQKQQHGRHKKKCIPLQDGRKKQVSGGLLGCDA